MEMIRQKRHRVRVVAEFYVPARTPREALTKLQRSTGLVGDHCDELLTESGTPIYSIQVHEDRTQTVFQRFYEHRWFAVQAHCFGDANA